MIVAAQTPHNLVLNWLSHQTSCSASFNNCFVFHTKLGQLSHRATICTAAGKSVAWTECRFCSVHDGECEKARARTPAQHTMTHACHMVCDAVSTTATCDCTAAAHMHVWQVARVDILKSGFAVMSIYWELDRQKVQNLCCCVSIQINGRPQLTWLDWGDINRAICIQRDCCMLYFMKICCWCLT